MAFIIMTLYKWDIRVPCDLQINVKVKINVRASMTDDTHKHIHGLSNQTYGRHTLLEYKVVDVGGMLRNGNVWVRNKGNVHLKASIANTDYDGSKTAGECGIFQLFG